MSTTRPAPTLFPPATLASQLAWPGTAQARQMTVGSGRKCCALLSSAGPAGSLVKMLLATSRWASTACFLTWKPQATKSGRLLFRLAPSTPRTAATGSGLLPTPTTTDAGTGRINRSPSPNATPRPTLALYFKLLPTPIANDAANPQAYPSRTSRKRPSEFRGLAAALAQQNPETAGLYLNPRFVLELMGFPPTWCDLTEPEMQQVRRLTRATGAATRSAPPATR